MNKREAIIAAAAALAWWYWRRQESAGAKAPVAVNASPNITMEDDTGEALTELIKVISGNPDLRTQFAFFGKGIDVTFTQSPPPSGIRYAIGGQPTIIAP